MSLEHVLQVPGSAKPVFPYSPAVKVPTTGRHVYLSGVLGMDANMNLVGSDITSQTTQIMENAKSALEAAGTSMDKVFKTAIMVVNISDILAVNEVYKSYFKEGHYPARSAYGVKELAKGALIEIEFIALE